jgi:hypothetical protein
MSRAGYSLDASDVLGVMFVSQTPPCQTSCRPIMIAEHPHRIDIYEQKFVFN